jgi:hypothetical protein
LTYTKLGIKGGLNVAICDRPGKLMVSACCVAGFQRAMTVLLVPKSIEMAIFLQIYAAAPYSPLKNNFQQWSGSFVMIVYAKRISSNAFAILKI